VTDEPAEPIRHIYDGYDRTQCEVEVDGAWHFAEVRSWDRDERGHWSAYVMWSTGAGRGNQRGRFPAERVRHRLTQRRTPLLGVCVSRPNGGPLFLGPIFTIGICSCWGRKTAKLRRESVTRPQRGR